MNKNIKHKTIKDIINLQRDFRDAKVAGVIGVSDRDIQMNTDKFKELFEAYRGQDHSEEFYKLYVTIDNIQIFTLIPNIIEGIEII